MKRLTRREAEWRAEQKKAKRHIKQGDKVKVLAGKDAGATGKVLRLYTSRNKALVEHVNMVKRHQRPTQTIQKGGIIEKEAPVNLSNLQLVCPRCSKPTRVHREKIAEGGSVRVCKKCKEMIDKV